MFLDLLCQMSKLHVDRRRHWLVGAPAEAVTGRGTGVDDATFQSKCSVVSQASARAWAAVAGPADVRPASEDGLAAIAASEAGRRRAAEIAAGLLTQVGGLEVAAMAGAMMTAAQVRDGSAMPVAHSIRNSLRSTACGQ